MSKVEAKDQNYKRKREHGEKEVSEAKKRRVSQQLSTLFQRHFGRSVCTRGDRLDLTSAFQKGCTTVSRWCLRAGRHCQLPSE
eukprot:11661282-Karenia_brevis.AAC.1